MKPSIKAGQAKHHIKLEMFAAAVVLGVGLIAWKANAPDARPSKSNMAQTITSSELAGSASRGIASVGGAAAPSANLHQFYKVHLKTATLDTFYGKKSYPAVTGLMLDGKLLYKQGGLRRIDQFLKLKAGRHVVILRMWDLRKQELDKKFILNVGPSIAKN